MNDIRTRCRWVNVNDPVCVKYHDEVWGVPLHDDRELYKWFILETFQAGLSWNTILKKQEAFEAAFDGFVIDTVCGYGEDKIRELLNDPGIVRSERKIRAAIRNSRAIREIQREYGSFDAYLWGMADNTVTYIADPAVTTNELSDRLSRDMKKRGMKYCGSVTMYAYLQGIGVINGHLPECSLAGTIFI